MLRSTPAFVLTGLLLAAPLAAAEGTATAPVFVSVSGPELQTLMQNWGYRADLGTDDYGDPMITSGAAGVEYVVVFYGCETPGGLRRCTSLTLQVGLDLANGIDMQLINDWNEGARFGRAYVDIEQDPWLEWDVVVEGGVTADNLERQFAIWNRTLGSFLEAVDW